MHESVDIAGIKDGLFQDTIVHNETAGRQPLKICVVGPTGSHLINQRICFFSRRGHDVTFVAEHVVNEPMNGVRIFSIPHVFHQLLGPYRQILAYSDAIRKIDPDIVHVHFAQGSWGWGAALAGRYPLVVSIMGGDILFDQQGKPAPRVRALTLALLKRADFITAKSNYLIAELRQLGGFDRKAVRILWMIDKRIFRRVDATALRSKLGIAVDEQVIFSPKSLQRFYNVHLIVDALPAILAREPRTKLIIAEQAAHADYKQELLNRIAELGLGNRVVFAGPIANEEMPDYYSLANVTVAIPPSDGMPMALLEGLACGVPNILSRLENTKEIVTDGENALMIDLSADAVARAVLRIFEEPALREHLVKNGLATVDDLPGLPDELELIERRFHQLLAEARPSTSMGVRLEIARQGICYSLERWWANFRVWGLLGLLYPLARPILRTVALGTVGAARGRRIYFLLRRTVGRPSPNDDLPPDTNLRAVIRRRIRRMLGKLPTYRTFRRLNFLLRRTLIVRFERFNLRGRKL
jgi:glycosyltransferase involved in cell wall biosynthesis